MWFLLIIFYTFFRIVSFALITGFAVGYAAYTVLELIDPLFRAPDMRVDRIGHVDMVERVLLCGSNDVPRISHDRRAGRDLF